jgi:lysophospholipase L1-like esterase
MKIAKGATVLFTGDSITDAGRARPVGKGAGLGSGYVAIVQERLKENVVLNTGISGHTVRDLAARWDNDVINLKPDWLSIMIGTNDVWRQFDKRGVGVLPTDYKATYRSLLTRVRPNLKGGLVLMTPFLVEANEAEPMRARMDEYRQIVIELAGEFGAYLVDTQGMYNYHMLQGATVNDIAGDRVHPSPKGHKIMAETWLSTVS